MYHFTHIAITLSFSLRILDVLHVVWVAFLSIQNTKLNQHLFWVAVGVLQLGDSSLFAASLSLVEACIKVLVDIHAFESQVRGRINNQLSKLLFVLCL